MSQSLDLEAIRAEVEELFRRRDFAAVEHLLAPISEDLLHHDLELSIKLAAAWSARYRNSEAKAILLALREGVSESGDETLVRRWQNLLAIQLFIAGDLQHAMQILEDCLGSAERARHHRIVAQASNGLGIIAAQLGQVELAVQHTQRALTAWQRLGDKYGVASAHHNLGTVLREWGQLEEAASHFLLAEEYFTEIGSPDDLVISSAERALLLVSLRDGALGERVARKALKRCDEIDAADYVRAAVNKVLGTILLVTRQLRASRERLVAARELIDATEGLSMKAEIHEEIAILELLEANYDAADKHKSTSLAYYASLGSENQSLRFVQRFEAVRRMESQSRTSE
jgi:tetratricopeptide (TPR) repeat protein